MTVSSSIFAFLHRTRYFVIIFWLGMAIWGGFCNPLMTNSTSASFAPPVGSPSFSDMLTFGKLFPRLANETTIICILHDSSDYIINNATLNFTRTLEAAFWGYSDERIPVSFLSYASFEDRGMTSLASPMISLDGHTTLIVMNLDGTDLHLVNVFTDWVVSFIMDDLEVNYLPHQVNVSVSGFPVEVRDSRREGKSLMTKMDAIVLPIALIIIMGFVRSWRLITIPIITIGVSILSSYAVGYALICLGAKVPDFSITLMMSAIIAMSIDYNLFLLTRFRLEIRRGFDTKRAAETMLATAGKNVLVSGLVVSICFSGTVLLPADLLSGLGLVAGMAIVVTIFVNLTLTPSILVTFPVFYGKFVDFSNLFKKKSDEAAHLVTTSNIQSRKTKVSKSLWFKTGRLAVDHPYIVLACVILLMLPFGLQLLWMHDEISFMNMVPKDGLSLQGINDLQRYFDDGIMAPYMILIDGVYPDIVCHDEFFTTVSAVVERLAKDVDNVTVDMIQSVTHVPKFGQIHWSFANQLLNRPDLPVFNTDIGLSYRWFWNQVVNAENSSTIIRLTLPADPFADSSRVYLDQIRSSLAKMPSNVHGSGNYSFAMVGGAATMFDLADLIFRMLPLMCGVTVSVCVLITAIAFRSAFLPIRVGITSLFAVVWSYGVSVIVFQYHALDWLVPSWQASHGLYWVTPVTSLCLILGLGLDFEMFLLISVIEIRNQGYSTRNSIIKGVYRTGGVISAAGIVMIMAFGSLFLSSSMVNNQYAMLICVSVFCDTFIVRTLLIPAIMQVMGPLNFWPQKVPEPFKDDDAVYDLED